MKQRISNRWQCHGVETTERCNSTRPGYHNDDGDDDYDDDDDGDGGGDGDDEDDDCDKTIFIFRVPTYADNSPLEVRRPDVYLRSLRGFK